MKLDAHRYAVRKFGLFSCEDPYDLAFTHSICWSRIYEYAFVLAELRALGTVRPRPAIHNAAWGFKDIHIVFKTRLDLAYPGSFHSDIQASSLLNTGVWDIASQPSEALHERFDAVLNISTLEEVSVDHRQVLFHHLMQLVPGGRFIATFDLPGLQLDRIEDYLGQRMVTPVRKLTPRNSRLPDTQLGLPDDFAVGYLVVECKTGRDAEPRTTARRDGFVQ